MKAVFWKKARRPLAGGDVRGGPRVVIQPVNMVSSPPLSGNTWKTAQPDADITALSGKTMRKTVRGDIL